MAFAFRYEQHHSARKNNCQRLSHGERRENAPKQNDARCLILGDAGYDAIIHRCSVFDLPLLVLFDLIIFAL